MLLSYYGTLVDAIEYFQNRLHATAWSDAGNDLRVKALMAATQIIDTLNSKGYKATVYALLLEDSLATDEEIREAEANQALEFQEGADTEVPDAIVQATYEIAYSLLDGRDPEMELESLGVESNSYASVRTAYNRDQVPIEHLVNGVPNALAWRLIRPFLREADGVRLSRV